MAILIPALGQPSEVHPPEGRVHFTVAEMQAFVGGYLEVVSRLPDGRVVWCNERGKLEQLPLNRLATTLVAAQLHGDVLVGDVIITTLTEAGEDSDVDISELVQPLDPDA